jgi:thiamine-monophosphate kinase
VATDGWGEGARFPDEDATVVRIAELLGSPPAHVLAGIGDDVATLAPDLVWTVDTLVEDVHFTRAISSPADVGWRALAVNLSDLAAVGAVPLGALVSLTMTAEGTTDVEPLYRGLAACAEAHGCPVVGGDITRGPRLVLSVTVLGRTAGPAPGRGGAHPGDVLVVTGRLGGSAAGLAIAQGRARAGAAEGALLDRHRRPRPRLDEGRALAPVAHALMDLSDGIATDARRLATRSGVRLTIDLDALPVDEGVAQVAESLGVAPGVLAATGGEDYELLAALPPERARDLGDRVTVVGEVEAGSVGVAFTGSGADRDLVGWDHLRGSTP